MKAELKSQQVIDWSKKQLVIDESGLVVMACVDQSDTYFSGIVIVHPDGFRIGEYETGFPKKDFKLFTGEVVLSN